MSDPHFLTLKGVTLAYGQTVVVDRINLTIAKGELVALLGPSGCGKTTIMRSIAGLLDVRSGTIELDRTDITQTGPNKREVGLVFQSYALFPHLSVFENIAFGLRLKKKSADYIKRRVGEGLAKVNLEPFACRKPGELSGGQQQRVALARSLVMDPKILLLDEPLSNLDARLRLDMRTELQRVQKESGLTMVFVTHDQSEALALADRIVVMKGGKIEQVGSPEAIYNTPVSGFVADFVGFENMFALKDGKLKTPDGLIPLSGEVPSRAAGLAWRPENITVGEGPFQGKVTGSSFSGHSRRYVLQTAFGQIMVEVDANHAIANLGEAVTFDLPVSGAAALQRM